MPSEEPPAHIPVAWEPSPRLPQAALAFCNFVRVQLNMPPVSELQPGLPGDMIDSCVQRTVGRDIATELYADQLWVLTPYRVFPLSRRVRAFVRAYDSGLFPDLYDWELIGQLLAGGGQQTAPFAADTGLAVTPDDVNLWREYLDDLPETPEL
jgi:hypothetical protein